MSLRRTTLNFPEGLMARFKKRCAGDGVSMSARISGFIANFLIENKVRVPKKDLHPSSEVSK